MSLEQYLGPWIYWPLVVVFVSLAIAAVSFTLVAVQSNVSLIYSETLAQVREIKRATGEQTDGKIDNG